MEFLFDLLREKGISNEEIEMLKGSLFLLLSLPLVTTITGFFRHIIGLKSLSVYAPIILTFAFYQLGYVDNSASVQDLSGEYNYFRGIQFGLALYIIVFLTSTIFYKLFKQVRMHYVPKTSIVMIGVVTSIIFAIIFGTALFERKGLIYMNVLSLLMIATLSEIFVSSMARKTFRNTAFVGLQTLMTAVIAYSLISINRVQEYTIDYAFLTLLILFLLNLYIGRFVGLRITEYWRFRELLFQEPVATNATKKSKSSKKK